MKKQGDKIVLGVDPGYGIVGFGFIKESKGNIEVLAYGVIRTPAKIDFIDRLKIISDDLKLLIKKYKPDMAGVEKIFFAKNTKTAIDVAQARGVILLSLIEANLPVVEITPLQVKQGLTGYGKADKRQIQQMVKTILKLKSIPKPDDAADALAIAITTSQYKKFV